MHEIERSRWQECLSSYAKQHRDWLARLVRTGGKSTDFARLVDVASEGSTVMIQLGDERYHLPGASRIHQLREADGDRGLRIDLADRTIFLLFRVAADPETLS